MSVYLDAVRIVVMKSVARLYEQFKPSHYDINLSIDKKNLTFFGKVTIEGTKTGRPSKRITFHQKGLNIHDARIQCIQKQQSSEISIKRIHIHEKYDEVRLHTENLIYPGVYIVEIAFNGIISSDMQGIYPSNYEHKGKTETIIGTQFESHHAREAFPCIDEPEAKATFQLTLNKSGKDVVLSNTSPIKETKSSITFAVTPKMSSYLLAFVIGPMHCYESKTKNGIVVRTWASLAQHTKMLTYSVDEAVKYLEFFTEYFGIPYPLEKCDQVALPDFDSGAMENWGLVTYRELALLSDADNPSVSSQQYISLVIAHELSHQWFGNLVTMKWWDDLWLNESFASIMEYIALDNVHPEWQMWEHYTSSDVLATTSRDIYSNIQPVGVKVTDPDIIETLFDPGIVYAKGGRLIKMMKELIGEEAFKKGLKLYFDTYAYTNATRNDLWACLGKVSNINVASFMTPWIEQPGMPMLTIKQGNNSLSVSQKRYLLDSNSTDTTVWPVALLSNSIKKPPIINKKQQIVHNIDDSVVINDQASGHYFVYYANKSHRSSVAQRFAQQKIDPTGRINLLNDIYMLSRKGIIPLTDGLEVIKKSPSENRDCVWILMSRIIGAASQLTEGDEKTETNIKTFKKNISSEWYEKLGWNEAETEDTNTRQLRISILALMLGSEDALVVKAALKKYNTYPELAKIPAEIRPLLLGAAVRHGDNQIINKLIEQYKAASADIQLDITNALSSTKIPSQAHIILKQALGPKGFVRSQDVLRWITMFIRNRYIRDEAWKFMEDNWAWLYDTLNRSKSFDYFPVYLAAVIANETYAKKYDRFFADKLGVKTLAKNIEIGRADIAARLEWRQREEDSIKAWFTK